MIKKIFKPSKQSIATLLITTTTFISYAIGLIRDRVIATNFGTTSATDTYNSAFLLPDIIFNFFIAGALTAAFMPVFSEYLEKDKNEAAKIANTVLTVGSLFIGAVSILLYIFAEPVIGTLFRSVDAAAQQDIVTMTRIMLPAAILFTISNATGNILMSYKHFVSYAVSPILYNLGIIGGILYLEPQYGIHSAAIGVLIGAILHCLIRVVDLIFTDHKFRPKFSIKSAGFKKILKLMIPRATGLIVWQINLYIFAVIGMTLLEGSWSAFNFARNIQSFAISLFGIAFATAVFPFLNSAINKGDRGLFTQQIQKSAQKTLFFTIPAAIGMIILSKPIVELILSGGAFQQTSINLTSIILLLLAISVPFESINQVLLRSFYALQNTKTPTIINVLSIVGSSIMAIYTAKAYGVEWLGISFSAGITVQFLLLTIFLKPHLKNFNIKELFTSILKTIISSGIMVIILLILSKTNIFIQIFAGATTFFVTAKMLQMEELKGLTEIKKRLLSKS